MKIDKRKEKHMSLVGCRRRAKSLKSQLEELCFRISNVRNLMYFKPPTSKWDLFMAETEFFDGYVPNYLSLNAMLIVTFLQNLKSLLFLPEKNYVLIWDQLIDNVKICN